MRAHGEGRAVDDDEGGALGQGGGGDVCGIEAGGWAVLALVCPNLRPGAAGGGYRGGGWEPDGRRQGSSSSSLGGGGEEEEEDADNGRPVRLGERMVFPSSEGVADVDERGVNPGRPDDTGGIGGCVPRGWAAWGGW